jgi:MFS family permease
MGIFSSLSRQQKEAVGLLQIGTFLEYFDLMLYVHMAVLLNELFFPKTDPHTASLLTAFAFCSTYVLRPFGALLFGYIGDHLGRKPTVILTTMMMALSCIIMANLPTYAQIGIASAWIVTACRIAQGLASMGEIIGAEVYITELVAPPAQYPVVSCVAVASQIGTAFALGVAALVTHFGFNWRNAFWIGAAIAVIGTVARTRLRETPEFLKKRQKIQKLITAECKEKISKVMGVIKTQKLINLEKMDKKTFWAYIAAAPGWPLSFYLTYMYFNQTLKTNCGYTSENIIFHNFLLSIISVAVIVTIALMSYKTNPLKIVIMKGKASLVVMLLLPFCIANATSHIHIFILQTTLIVTAMSLVPGYSLFLKHIPILRRFTTASFFYASSRAVTYVITSFSLVFLTDLLGYYGLWVIMLPVNIGFIWGVQHFEKLEKQQHQHVQVTSPKGLTKLKIAG